MSSSSKFAQYKRLKFNKINFTEFSTAVIRQIMSVVPWSIHKNYLKNAVYQNLLIKLSKFYTFNL